MKIWTRKPKASAGLACTLLASLVCLAGCDGLGGRAKEPAITPLEPPSVPDTNPALRGTIGEITYLQGILKMSVRGYGLVVGLGQKGSRSCPEHIRKRVASEVRKKYRLGDSRIGLGHLSAEKLISDPDTAVVLVWGEIGAGALRGTRFDLFMQALPGTETVSLEGGLLYACDLRYFRSVDMATVQEGKVLALGEGHVFCLPNEEASASGLQRTAMVISGGSSMEDRRIKLRLVTPSYAMAVRVQDRINTRFGQGERIASADSPGMVSLKILPEYLGRELEFVSLVQHLYVSEDVGYSDRRPLELAHELEAPEAPHDGIGLALEGIGQTVRPVVRGLYEAPQDHARFIAARTGLRLGDELACSALQDFAREAESPYHLASIIELGRARNIRRASRVLAGLSALDLPDLSRIGIYEGLLLHEHPMVGGSDMRGHFILDRLASRGPPLIYAKTVGEGRMVVIGDATCRTPLFYKHDRGVVQISAQASDDYLTVVRQTATGKLSPPAHSARGATELIRLLGGKARESRQNEVLGLGICYSQVIEVVRDLCDDGTLNATFVLERDELLTPPAPEEESDWIGRPDSEL